RCGAVARLVPGRAARAAASWALRRRPHTRDARCDGPLAPTNRHAAACPPWSQAADRGAGDTRHERVGEGRAQEAIRRIRAAGKAEGDAPRSEVAALVALRGRPTASARRASATVVAEAGAGSRRR